MKLTKEHLIENEVKIGDNIEEAIYILVDGTLWDGGFDYGCRCVEHREAEVFTETDRYDDDFWKEVMIDLGLIMLIPETKQVVIHPDYEPTEAQKKRIKEAIEAGYEIEEFK